MRFPLPPGRELRFRKVGHAAGAGDLEGRHGPGLAGPARRAGPTSGSRSAPSPPRRSAPRATEAVLEGARPTPEVADRAAETLAGELSPIDDVRSTADYRRAVSARVLHRAPAGRRRLVTGRAPSRSRRSRRSTTAPAAGVRAADGAALRRRARVPVAALGGAAVRVGGAALRTGPPRSPGSCPEPLQVELIDAHPRLGAPPATVSAMSFREQGYDRRGSGESRLRGGTGAGPRRGRAGPPQPRVRGAVRLPLLRLRGRPTARAAPPGMAAALAQERESELHRALDAVVDIARDRSGTVSRRDRRRRAYELGENRYGKSRIRLVTVRRGPERHDLRDMTVAVALEGEFDAVHTRRRQRRRHRDRHDEEHGLRVRAGSADRLAGGVRARAGAALHWLRRRAAARSIDIVEHPWSRVTTRRRRGARTRSCARASYTRLASVAIDRAGAVEVTAGIDDLTVMKTTKSAFAGFDRDRYTTLAEVDDRLMATKVRATWGYRSDLAGGGALRLRRRLESRERGADALARRALQPLGPGVDLDHGHAR